MSENMKRLYRSRSDRMLSGLCSGLGYYVGIDPTIVRLAFALGSIFLFPIPIIVYLVMMLVVPEEPGQLPVVKPEVIVKPEVVETKPEEPVNS